jgi:hypothetical protein
MVQPGTRPGSNNLPRTESEPTKYFSVASVRSPASQETLYIAHQCAVMYNLAEGD